MTRHRFRTAIIVLLTTLSGAVSGRAGTTIEFYPDLPRHRSDGKVSGTIEGQPVRFESFRTSPEYYYDTTYARLAADGPVQVQLGVPRVADPPTPRRLPHLGGGGRGREGRDRNRFGMIQDDSTLRFTLPGPGNYYLQLPDLGVPQRGNPDSGTYTVLFFIDDLAALRASREALARPGVSDVTRSGVVSDPSRDQTRAIDAVLARAGTIVFPAGIYRTAKLKVRSNTRLYLAPGALILGTDGNATKRFIDLAGAANVRIWGPGTVDANAASTHIVNTEKSRNITLEDTLYRNSRSWAIHLLLADQVEVRNVRILNGKDGIDPDGAKDVTIEDCCVLSKDDAIVVKTRTPGVSSERVTVRHCTVASDASALKVGTETRALIRGVLFEDCDVFDSDRGVVIYARDGGAVEDVTWRNIRMSLIHWPRETGGSPFVFDISRREGFSRIKNCLVENVVTNQVVPSILKGLNEAPLDGLAFRNISIRVDEPPPARKGRAAKPHLFDVSGPVKMAMDGLAIDWQGHEGAWSGVASVPGFESKHP